MIRAERGPIERLLRLEREMWERKCRRDLTAWTIEALAPMNQSPARHHRLLIEHLEKVAKGEIKRLMVCMPPGSAKSTYSSVLFPAWMFAQSPNFDMIGASHGSELAEKFSAQIQAHVRQNEAILGYGLASENVKAWRTTNGGNYRAAGIGGSITGRRADGAILDDPIKGAADAESLTIRDMQWNWYLAELYTRLKPEGWIILILTRWNEDDLAGRLLQAQADGKDEWTVLKLPAICDAIDDPLGRAIGDPLWPEWQDADKLAHIRKNVLEYVWGALYQQDPKPRGASFFDTQSLLVDGRPAPTPANCDVVLATIDTAVKTGNRHDSTGVTYWAYNSLTKPTTYILDWDIQQLEYAHQEVWLPNVYARLEELAKQCGARRGSAGAFIEDKQTGSILLQQAANYARTSGTRAMAHAIDSKLTAAGKDERAIAAAGYVCSGDIVFTEDAYNKTKIHKGKSANHLLSQIEGFRLGAKDGASDDLLDTFTYGVLVTHEQNSGPRRMV